MGDKQANSRNAKEEWRDYFWRRSTIIWRYNEKWRPSRISDDADCKRPVFRMMLQRERTNKAPPIACPHENTLPRFQLLMQT